MPSFTDIASAVRLPGCCMRKNPSPKEQLNEDITMLGISFSLYIASYCFGFHSLCLISMLTMNLLTFQAGITFHEAYSKTIHINAFEELDSSMEEYDDSNDYLSLKQREQGATRYKSLTEEEEQKLNEQFQQVVEETKLRNRKRSALNTARTPSSTTLIDESEVAPLPSDNGDYSGMPDLVSPEDKPNPVVAKPYTMSNVWSEVPNFSQTHYLHNYMDEVD